MGAEVAPPPPEGNGDGAPDRVRDTGEGIAEEVIATLFRPSPPTPFPEFREHYMRSGLDDHLTKPVDWTALERVLHRFAPVEQVTLRRT